MAAHDTEGPTLGGPVRDWFAATFPGGPTPAQALAWPVIAAGRHLLLVSPTGTGKTLAAFLAILDRLFREQQAGTLMTGLRCVYITPLRSLGYDIERNLSEPLDGIRCRLGREDSPVRVAVRTGDTSHRDRRLQREAPSHLLITTPESLSILLSQSSWHALFRDVQYVICDEIHSLVPTKRGADLAVSIERLTGLARSEPCRIGLSATCRPTEPVARFLVGTGRDCKIIEAPDPPGHVAPRIEVESLLRPGEAPHRGLTYRRLLRCVGAELSRNRTTIVFANTRALAEKITHDLRRTVEPPESIAAHHSALDATRRREVEAAMKDGSLRAVVSSTSLELGVDIGTADLTAMVGLPGSASRCLQRVGRSGHRVGSESRGLLLVASAAELAGAAVTAEAARAGRVEPLRPVAAPLDVLCQQLLGMACAGEVQADAAFHLVRRTAPFEQLLRADFDACLAFLAGDLAAPPGAYEPEPGATPRWTAPRLWRSRGVFGVRSSRVSRLFRTNAGTITSEETVSVVVEGRVIGTVEGVYAERLQAGDRFVLDGRALEVRRLDARVLFARPSGGEPDLPRWSSDRQALSHELACDLARFRDDAARLLAAEGPSALRAWLEDRYRLDPDATGVLIELFTAQDALSLIPEPGMLLVEESPSDRGWSYVFHAPLSRSACEALGRATGARLGRRFGRDVALVAADLGWSLTLAEGQIGPDDLATLLEPEGFADDVLAGLDRGELLARRFRHVAATALMVLRNPERGRTRVGGLMWVSQRLYPLVRAACPDHPLLRETRREVLDDLLDTPSALAWLRERPTIRFRSLEAPSPFAAAWIDAGGIDPLRFEPPAEALRRLHSRLVLSHEG